MRKLCFKKISLVVSIVQLLFRREWCTYQLKPKLFQMLNCLCTSCYWIFPIKYSYDLLAITWTSWSDLWYHLFYYWIKKQPIWNVWYVGIFANYVFQQSIKDFMRQQVHILFIVVWGVEMYAAYVVEWHWLLACPWGPLFCVVRNYQS